MSNRLNAKPDELILWFDEFDGSGANSYRFLSNFFVGEPLIIDGWTFATGEHAFQAAKAKNLKTFEMVRTADGPGHAKALGRGIPLRDDWEAVKYDVMAAVIRSKFTLERQEGLDLYDTGEALLVEGTYWGDTVWGVDLHSPTSEELPTRHGRNWLGTLLMARRAELRAEQLFGMPVRTASSNTAFFRWPEL